MMIFCTDNYIGKLGHFAEYFRTYRWMSFYNSVFSIVKSFGFVDNIIRHTYLSDIVKQTYAINMILLLLRHIEMLCNKL